MSRKEIIYLIANIPFAYLLFISFGWMTFALVGGNPTYFFPFGSLVFAFFILATLVSLVIIKTLKINNKKVKAIAICEIAVIYFLLWYFLR